MLEDQNVDTRNVFFLVSSYFLPLSRHEELLMQGGLYAAMWMKQQKTHDTQTETQTKNQTQDTMRWTMFLFHSYSYTHTWFLSYVMFCNFMYLHPLLTLQKEKPCSWSQNDNIDTVRSSRLSNLVLCSLANKMPFQLRFKERYCLSSCETKR